MRRPSLEKTFVPSTADPTQLGRLLGQFWEGVRKALEPLLSNPRAESSVITASLVAATAKSINHKLNVPAGKTPEGWHITDLNSAAIVHRQDWDDKTITLVASVNCDVTLEVW